MDTERTDDPQPRTPKRAYREPAIVDFGPAEVLTQQISLQYT